MPLMLCKFIHEEPMDIVSVLVYRILVLVDTNEEDPGSSPLLSVDDV